MNSLDKNAVEAELEASIHTNLGLLYLAKEDLLESERNLLKARAILAKRRREGVYLAGSYDNLGLLNQKLGRHKDAEKFFRMQLREAHGDQYQREEAYALLYLGRLRLAQSNPVEAAQYSSASSGDGPGNWITINDCSVPTGFGASCFPAW